VSVATLHHTVKVPSTVEAPRYARRSVGGWISDRVPKRTLDDVLLATSELVTNAVLHAEAEPQSSIRVEVIEIGRTLRVCVIDRGHGFDWQPSTRARRDERGLGLEIVRRVAERCGVNRNSQNCVWFEVDLRRRFIRG